ncbi:glycoside hydrolase superfamily [Gaertneriomyces semiglobifer]|nr:glycoside hydrolase superfamily [Gaertneriomyces semiglobifer]
MANSTAGLVGFITRSANSLIDPVTGGPLRFVSYNLPNLFLIDDPEYAIPDEFEQDDLLSTIAQFGGRVARTYVFGVQTAGESAATALKHIIKEGSDVKLNERMMVALDKALALANERGVRLIIPFIDRWEWWGGVESFVKLYDPTLPASAFYTEPSIQNGFKSIIEQIITRVNTVTNIAYREDPAILAWETGNELEIDDGRIPTDWTLEIASHIKGLDRNHLVMDGSWKHGWDERVLQDPNIDIYSNHYYRQLGFTTIEWAGLGIMAAILLVSVVVAVLSLCLPKTIAWLKERKGDRFSLRRKRILTVLLALILMGGSAAGIALLMIMRHNNPLYGKRSASDAAVIASHNKVFIAGEFGFAPERSYRQLLDNVERGVMSGAMLWSLRGHSKDGGFYTHEEMHGYLSYHYPGFPEGPGFSADERTIVPMITSYASRLASQFKYPIPSSSLPAPPVLLGASTGLIWRGVAGASDYQIEQQTGSSQWNVVATGIHDNKMPGQVLYPSVTKGAEYRVRARNAAGLGAPSNSLPA